MGFIEYYVIIGLSFVFTSLYTLQLPVWRIVNAYFKEHMPENIPTKLDIFYHVISYSIVAFIIYPALVVLILTDNKKAIEGYTKGVIEARTKK